MVLPEPAVLTSCSPFLTLPMGTYAINGDLGSRLSARAASSGNSTMRLPSGSIPPPGSGRRMRPRALTKILGTLVDLTTFTQVVGLRLGNQQGGLPAAPPGGTL